MVYLFVVVSKSARPTCAVTELQKLLDWRSWCKVISVHVCLQQSNAAASCCYFFMSIMTTVQSFDSSLQFITFHRVIGSMQQCLGPENG